MTLEHWDPNKRKYVLYRSAEQHSEDCVRFPFEGKSWPRSSEHAPG
jgi:hypothetical protein